MFGLFSKKRIYLDYASATPILPEALRAMNFAERLFANPGAIHKDGVAARKTLESAREEIARELGCRARQITFTSGLTESNNLAILGHARKLRLSGKALEETHWVVSSIEHDSVLECFAEVERLGGTVSFIDPDKDGRFSPEILQRALRPETIFVSIGWANNEIGVVQPLSELARTLRGHEGKGKILFHSDAGQAPLYLSPQVHTLGVDMLSLGGGKLYGPRSCGALYVEELNTLAPILLGGGQERGLRAGTEDVVPVVGFAKAFGIISAEQKTENIRLRKLRDLLATELQASIPGLIINGNLKHVLPHMLNISIPSISSEYIVLALDRKGIAISTKSACRAGENSSHVVAALALAAESLLRPPKLQAKGGAKAAGKEWRARNTLRLSLGRETTKRDIARGIEALKSTVKAHPAP